MMLVLCGKSGSGKDTIAGEILRKYSEDSKRLVSHTSRPMRDGEENGREYYFISEKKFLEGIKNNNFVEYRSYNTLVEGKPDKWYYGTQKFEKTSDGTLLVAIKDLEGAKVLKDYCEEIGEHCECILVEVPDKIREDRAKLRGSFDQMEWGRRLGADAIDFSEEKKRAVVDKVIQNDGSMGDVSTLADFCHYSATHPAEKESELEM